MPILTAMAIEKIRYTSLLCVPIFLALMVSSGVRYRWVENNPFISDMDEGR
jgi:hypothetical protein